MQPRWIPMRSARQPLRCPACGTATLCAARGEAGRVHVDLHIHVAPELTIVEAHEITRDVESAIRRLELGIAEVLVHLGADQTVS